jgi:hypothetical protein
MSDLVKRLRLFDDPMCVEAADRIEALEAALREIADHPEWEVTCLDVSNLRSDRIENQLIPLQQMAAQGWEPFAVQTHQSGGLDDPPYIRMWFRRALEGKP